MGIACPLALVFLLFLPFGVLALHDANRRPTRQFTIRGMMLFIFLWAVCLSQISMRGAERPADTVAWRQVWTAPFAWIVLAVFYWRAREYAALLLHGTGILFVVSFFAICLAGGGRETWGEIGLWLWVAMFGGSFLGLIFFSLMMLLTMLRRPLSSPPHEENRQP